MACGGGGGAEVRGGGESVTCEAAGCQNTPCGGGDGGLERATVPGPFPAVCDIMRRIPPPAPPGTPA